MPQSTNATPDVKNVILGLEHSLSHCQASVSATNRSYECTFYLCKQNLTREERVRAIGVSNVKLNEELAFERIVCNRSSILFDQTFSL